MRRWGFLCFVLPILVAPLCARHETAVCGTTTETSPETLFLHRQAVRARAAQARPLDAATPAASGNRDVGNIAIIEDADGVVARQNQFNLDLKTLRFAPTGTGYRYAVSDGGYDAA